MAWMASQNNVVLFGGQSGGTNSNQTWVWNGSTWTHLSPPGSPTPRNFAGMAADHANNQIVLFGGAGGVGPGTASRMADAIAGRFWL